MKVVILCGGQGSRIRDVADIVPKPMLFIGNRPILWHIMKTYSHYGFNDFVLCLGYKGWEIKEFFLNYYARTSDITIGLNKDHAIEYHNTSDEAGWKVTLVDTGESSQTGSRVRLVADYLKDCDRFALTYGDGLADVNVKALVDQHIESGLKVTISGVHPSGRFGEIEFQNNIITEFNEKPNVGSGLINGGFMICEKDVIAKYFDQSKDEVLEKDVIPKIVKDEQVGIYEHSGFWQCMDTQREYLLLNKLWNEGKAPWKVWA